MSACGTPTHTPRSYVLVHALHRYDFTGWNRAFMSAFKKGANACTMGHGIASCPYMDVRKQDGRLTWSRAFVAAWRDGWQWAYKLHSGADWEE